MDKIKLYAVFLLLVLIFFQFNFLPRYHFYNGDFQWCGDFTNNLNGWEVAGGEKNISFSDGVATITNNDHKTSVQLICKFPIPNEGEGVVVRSDVKTASVKGGRRLSYGARIRLIGLNKKGWEIWENLNSIVQLKGTQSWQRHSGWIPITGKAVQFKLEIGLKRSTGVMSVRNLQLVSVSEKLSFTILSYVLSGLLVMALLWIFIPALQNASGFAARMGVVGMLGVIISGVLLPATLRSQFSTFASDFGYKVAESLPSNLELALDDGGGASVLIGVAPAMVGHFFAFAILAVISKVAWQKEDNKVLVFYLMVFAALSEIIQFYSIGREPSFGDWAVDSAGILSGVLLVILLQRFRQLRH